MSVIFCPRDSKVAATPLVATAKHMVLSFCCRVRCKQEVCFQCHLWHQGDELCFSDE